MFRLAKKKKKKKKKQRQKAQMVKNRQEKSLSNKTDKRTIVYCRCTCQRHTLVFGIRKAWSREIDGLPKASMAKLLVTKQDPNSCDRFGKSLTNLETMSLNY